MKNFTYLLIVIGMLQSQVCQATPRYDAPETRRIVEAMLEAHGGMERWQAAPAIHFDNVMHNGNAGPNQFAWWVAHESIDKTTRRVHQDWPMYDAKIGFDGENVWSVNWNSANPAEFMVHFFFYFVNLPWLSQDDGVALSSVDSFTWPGTERELHSVKMTFDAIAAQGKTEKDFFVLYIDPDSHRLVAYQYAIGYRPMLELMNVPADREVFGPMWRLITRYQEVEGLLFPTAFRTMPEPGGRIVGNHVILNIDVAKPFDGDSAVVPPNAELASR